MIRETNAFRNPTLDRVIRCVEPLYSGIDLPGFQDMQFSHYQFVSDAPPGMRIQSAAEAAVLRTEMSVDSEKSQATSTKAIHFKKRTRWYVAFDEMFDEMSVPDYARGPITSRFISRIRDNTQVSEALSRALADDRVLPVPETMRRARATVGIGTSRLGRAIFGAAAPFYAQWLQDNDCRGEKFDQYSNEWLRVQEAVNIQEAHAPLSDYVLITKVALQSLENDSSARISIGDYQGATHGRYIKKR